MRGYLIFVFHPQGCSITLAQEHQPQQIITELSALDLLRLGIEASQLFAFMECGTESYFNLRDEGTGVPQAFYKAFKEKGGEA